MKFCKFCGTQLPDEANHCSSCGNACNSATPTVAAKRSNDLNIASLIFIAVATLFWFIAPFMGSGRSETTFSKMFGDFMENIDKVFENLDRNLIYLVPVFALVMLIVCLVNTLGNNRSATSASAVVGFLGVVGLILLYCALNTSWYRDFSDNFVSFIENAGWGFWAMLVSFIAIAAANPKKK